MARVSLEGTARTLYLLPAYGLVFRLCAYVERLFFVFGYACTILLLFLV
jgi:hypothetical protein